MEAKDKLIVALDYTNLKDVKGIVEELGSLVDIYKVGLESFLNTDGKIIDYLQEKGKKIFLDLKFHDITNTVLNACKYAAKKNILMFNIHCSNGSKTIKAVSNMLKEVNPNTLFIGVTVLTNLDQEDLDEMFDSKFELKELVLNMAKYSYNNGMHGVVCSPREASIIKEKISKDFVTVCPGVRPKSMVGKDDQKRVMTAGDAIRNGSDYLVVGRPITKSEDRKKAASEILKEIEDALN